MKDSLNNKWLLALMALTSIIGIAVGLLISLNIFGNESTKTDVAGDRLMLANGQSLIGGGAGHLPALITKDQVWEQNQPVTLTDAKHSEWEMESQCTMNVGYYSKRTTVNGKVEPYSLIFDNEGKLTGIYLFSEVQQNPPWQSMQTTGPFNQQHWGLHIFFYEQSNACP